MHTIIAKTERRPDHAALYRIAEQQAGYFTARQAGEAGFSRERLSGHTQRGRFQRVSRGVYRLTQFPSSRFEDLVVAWLSCGPKSVISHESALALFDLSDVVPSVVNLIVPRTSSRRRKGFRLHTNHLRPEDVVRREGLPVTTVPRTIADVAKTGLSPDHVHRAIREALERGLATKQALLAEAKRRGGRAAKLIREAMRSSGRQS